MSEDVTATGPDLSEGVTAESLPDGEILTGRVGDEPVLLVRSGNEFHAVGATCTHYGAPLADGIVVGDTLRCPWHHACFNLRNGEATGAPALNPIACWKVERRGDKVFVTERHEIADGATPAPGQRAPRNPPDSVVIIGAGAAGNAAAEMLRRQGFTGPVTMVGAEDEVPYDRPNLSKDYLAGEAPEEWIPLRPREFYDEHGITLRLGSRASVIDTAGRQVHLEDGSRLSFDRLLIATGADPVRLDIPGVDADHVHYLRSLADSRAIIAASEGARRAVVIGASFIGLEVAASLRNRGLEVHVVGPEARPLERVLGAGLGTMIQRLHESRGVVFHLEDKPASISASSVTLASGGTLETDLVVIGIGVRPNVELAASAGLATDRGILVNEYLETSAPGIYAAGDLARWPDARTGERIRVEHWVVAERQGQAAARNMVLDEEARQPFDSIPFFWSRHYETSIRYVGHAERWDEVLVDGDLEAGDATVTFNLSGRTAAVATVGRDGASLRAEAEMERLERSAHD